MSQSSEFVADDLVRLWRESVVPGPDPERLTNDLARLAVRRFDRAIFSRNAREYAGVLAAMAFGAWRWTVGDDPVEAIALTIGAAFVGAYLWYRHRQLPAPDPAASAREFQAALLTRIDRQIALLGSVRYWYLLPLYIPVLAQVAHTWLAHQRLAAIVILVVVTAIYAAIAWLNERLAVNFLRDNRARVAALYENIEE